MTRLVLVGALFAGACGTTDDRPRTLSYITEAILAPTCASAECHSAFKRAVGDQFDTVEATRVSVVANGLVAYPGLGGNVTPADSLLIQTLTIGFQSRYGNGRVRMPYDAPMPDADIDLIGAWISEGAKGAQCVANAAGQGCSITHDGPVGHPFLYHVVECSADGNRGNVVKDCTGNQVCDYYLGNGQCL